MRHAVKLLAVGLCALAGCAGDPCDGKDAVCISLRVEGQAPALDRLDVQVALPGGRVLTGRTEPVSPAIELPVVFAVRLPSPDALGADALHVIGSQAGVPLAAGATTVNVPQSGHAAATVTLAPLGAVDGGAPFDLAHDGVASDGIVIGGDGGSADAIVSSADLAGGVTAIASPDPQIILVNTSAGVGYRLTNNSAAPITISGLSLQSVPPGLPATFTNTACNGATVPVGGSCTAGVSVSPTQRGTWTLDLIFSHGPDFTTASSTVTAVAWANETVAVSNLFAVGGTSPSNVWAAGASSTIMHKAGSGATAWTGPMNVPFSPTTISSVYASPTSPNVYFSTGSPTIPFYNGSAWSSYTLVVQNNANIIGFWANSESDVFLLTSGSEVLRGTFGAPSTIRASDMTGYGVVGGSTGGAWVAGASGAYAQEMAPNSWAANVLSGYAFYGVWSDGTDTYLVGSHNGQGTVVHFNSNGSQTQDFAGVTRLNGVWGSSSGIWGTGVTQVFAVGSGGSVLHLASASGSWVPESTGLAPDLYGVWGVSGEVFAVGANGTIVHRY